MKNLSDNLLTLLTQANVCCMDCGRKYGKYSVGCSSVHSGTCDVCGEFKPITETRDFGYLVKGIEELKGNIKEQSAKVADYLLSVGPIVNDSELDGYLTASYERGDIACRFEKGEIIALLDVLKEHEEAHPPGWNEDYDSAFEKIQDLFDDNCITYSLSPALAKYHELYGTWGCESDAELAKWEVFRDAFHAGADYSKEVKVSN